MTESLWQSSLDKFQNDVAAEHGKAAAVAIACVTAVLGLSILVKALLTTRTRQGFGSSRGTSDSGVAGSRRCGR